MYKFLSKTWSYFMGLKDMFLLMLSMFSIFLAIGVTVPEVRSYAEYLLNNNKEDKVSYKSVKKRPKMGFHIVETD